MCLMSQEANGVYGKYPLYHKGSGKFIFHALASPRTLMQMKINLTFSDHRPGTTEEASNSGGG